MRCWINPISESDVTFVQGLQAEESPSAAEQTDPPE